MSNAGHSDALTRALRGLLTVCTTLTGTKCPRRLKPDEPTDNEIDLAEVEDLLHEPPSDLDMTVKMRAVPDDDDTEMHFDPVPEGPAGIEDAGGSGFSLDSLPVRPVFILAGCGGLLVLGLIIVGAVLLLGRGGGWTTLNADNPSENHPDGITITLVDGERLRVKLGSVPRESFLGGDAGREMQAARDAIPAYLDMKSPMYTIEADGEGGTQLTILIPNASQPYNTLDLYQWDEEAGRWVFVSGEVDETVEVITSDERPTTVAVFQTQAITPLISTTLEPGQSLDAESAAAVNVVYPTGLTFRADGTVEGTLVGGWQTASGYAVLPVIRSNDPATTTALLNNAAARALHASDLAGMAADEGFNGIALDYQAVPPEDRATFAMLVEEVRDALAAHNLKLAVILPPPTDLSEIENGGYDWRAIGAAADIVVLTPGNNPAFYGPDGIAVAMLELATSEISRVKLHFGFSSLSAQTARGIATPLSYDDALAPLGMVDLVNNLPDDARIEAGTELIFALDGAAENLSNDPSGALVYPTQGGQVWIVTASTVRNRWMWPRRITSAVSISATCSTQATMAAC